MRAEPKSSKVLPPSGTAGAVNAFHSSNPAADLGCYYADSCICWANLNQGWDGVVNDDDFLLFVNAYEVMISPPALPRADLNRDGLVDDSDFSLFVRAYDALLCP